MIIVGISGASGPVIGIRLIEELLKAGETVSAVASKTAGRIIAYEMMKNKGEFLSIRRLLEQRNPDGNFELFREFDNHDFFSPPASGSSDFEAVVVAPCSMKTLSAIVHGYADSLITRACDVALKEKRRCILIPRETPLNSIHTENIHKASLAGIEILLPVPGFYTYPETIDDVINFIVGKTLSLLGRKHNLFESWEKAQTK